MSATAGSGVEVAAIDTPALGDRSYLAHDGEVALVVDPQRDIDRVLALAATRGLRITTPGHTFTHLSYALEAGGRVSAVFTGGSLLYGSTGRPDLLGRDRADELAHAQFASARRLAAELPQDTDVYPTHGFGSFCSATQSEGGSSTIGRERTFNPVLALDEDRYVRELLAGLDAYPAYYAHMGPANAAGPSGPDLSPPGRAGAAELRRRIEAGEWVVDLRARRAFAAGHVPGALSFDLDGGFATYLGWLIPWDTPLTLLGRTPEQVAEAQRELVRIGIDRPAAAATGRPEDWAGGRALRGYPVADFAGLAAVRRHREVVVLDVRRDQEWEESHIGGAVHVPLHRLPARLAEVPAGEVWVHCETGYRASVAASFLDAAGRTVVAVDDQYDHAGRAGLPLTVPGHAVRTGERAGRHARGPLWMSVLAGGGLDEEHGG